MKTTEGNKVLVTDRRQLSLAELSERELLNYIKESDTSLRPGEIQFGIDCSDELKRRDGRSGGASRITEGKGT